MLYLYVPVFVGEAIEHALEAQLFPSRKYNPDTDFKEDLSEEEERERQAGMAEMKQELLRWVDEDGMVAIVFDTKAGTAIVEEREQLKKKDAYAI